MDTAKTSSNSDIASLCTFNCPCIGVNEELECGGEVVFSVALDPLDDRVYVITIRSTHTDDRTA